MAWDAVIIGAGAVGTSTAMHLARQGQKVLVLEKEAAPACHQSGRNSGVIHAGYNVAPGTEKARYCVEGNRELHAFCDEHEVPVSRGGILVVARNDQERSTLTELERRARLNGLHTKSLEGNDQIQSHEPHAAGVAALLAEEGSSLDAGRYVLALQREAEAAGAEFRFGSRVHDWQEHGDGVTVRSSSEVIQANALVNAAGLHADRIAQDLAPDLRIIPFRGYYAQLRPPARTLVRSHIYAVPDLSFPFLGVHLSRRTDGAVYVGPGAMLAFGREAYRFWHLHAHDLAGTLAWPGFWRMMGDPRVRGLMRSEVAKSMMLRAIWKEARLLVPELKAKDLMRGAVAGNRAQIVDREGKLVGDIVVRQTPRTVHVLNAVSPGLTCSLPFGRELAGRIGR